MPGIVYQVEEVDGIAFIVLDKTLLKSTNLLFEEYRQPNGDLYFKLVNPEGEKSGDSAVGSSQTTDNSSEHNDLQLP